MAQQQRKQFDDVERERRPMLRAQVTLCAEPELVFADQSALMVWEEDGDSV